MFTATDTETDGDADFRDPCPAFGDGGGCR